MAGVLSLGYYANGSGTYNLNGGLLSLAGIPLVSGSGAAAFNFGGGTLGASAPWSSAVSHELDRQQR